MKLAIITHILHKEYKEKYFSYSPYINEMDIWLKYASDICIVAPKAKEAPNLIETSYASKKIDFKPIPSIEFTSLKRSIISFFNLPVIVWKIIKEFKNTDHIHLRCPGNIGLLGSLVQVLFPNKPKTVKYAGNWDPDSKQPWSYNLQKWILGNTFFSKNIKVLVYGKWPNQSANIVPFFTASFRESEKEFIHKEFNTPYEFLFVGSLNEGKRPLFAIEMMEEIIKNGIPVKLKIYGNGNLKEDLQRYIQLKNLEPFVQLMGNRDLETLKAAYKASHFLILPSKSEGWPKALAEAMFFGCVPISTAVSCVPWMLQNGDRGILIEPDSIQAATKVIEKIKMPEELKLMSEKAQKWSQYYTLEKFEDGIKTVLQKNEKLHKKSLFSAGKGTGKL